MIGAGVVGVTSAWALSRDGWQVSVLDEAAEPASGASWGNGRQLSYSYTDALAQPGLLPSIPRLALGLDPAFRMAMPASLAQVSWLAQFLRNCTAAKARANTLECLSLALQSRDELHALCASHPFDFSHRTAGKLVLYRDLAALAKAREAMTLKVAHGAQLQVLAPQEIAQYEPALHALPGLAGAIYAPGDEAGDCASFTRQLMALAEREYGAQFHGGRSVVSLARQGPGGLVHCAEGEALEAELVLVCGGFRSNALLAPLGHALPIQPMKGYSFIAPVGPRAPERSVTDSSRRIVFTNLGDRMLVAGLADLGDGSAGLDAARMARLKAGAEAALPDAAIYSEAHSEWCGHRPLTPNSLPVTRMLEPWLAVNSGHGMLGWTLAMGSAAKLAEAVRQALGEVSPAGGVASGPRTQQGVA